MLSQPFRIAALAGMLLCRACSAAAAPAQPMELTQWRSGLIEINEGWAAHEGDDQAWAQPDFDDSGWTAVDIEDMGPARLGWHWFRKRVNMGQDHPDARLLLEGGDGTYEVYVNGARMTGADLRSAFNVYRPIERVFALHDEKGEFTIALRTHAPPNYVNYRLPLFMYVTLGGPTAIGYERAAIQADRLNDAWPSMAINLLLCLAGIGVLCLYLGQRGHRDYLFLGLYLFVLGFSDGLWNMQLSGIAPTSLNMLGSDLLVYVYTILQIEFTFSFVGKRPGRAMRIYQGALLLPWILAYLCWIDRFSAATYALAETAITFPVAVILTVLLLVWYRRGNREAGWLIFPSLLPLTMAAVFDLGSVSIFLGWGRFDFLDSLIPIGLLHFQPVDLANLVFLLAIAVVMFFRFTRVGREQARSKAELEAAREVQRRLVNAPAEIPGFRIEAAYLPAAHVGGDFFYIRRDGEGGLNLVVGDVSGKGLRAAMTVAAIIGAFRALPSMMPGRLLTLMNQAFVGEMREGFVTCCAAHIGAGGTMTIANAGHPAPYRDGMEVDCGSALPIGLAAGVEYEEHVIELTLGEKLTFLSDGVVEARNPAGEMLGFERTAALSTQSAEEIAQAAKAFGQDDDITVLTVELRETPSNAPANAQVAG